MQINVDGVRCLRTRAEPDRRYTIDLPTGDHTIQVDNVGRDWISIAGYQFAGLGSAVDAYTLLGSDRRSAAGWVLSHLYNHRNLTAGTEPPLIFGAELVLPHFAPGEYLATWFDCQTGAVQEQHPVRAQEGGLALPIPDLHWDAAFWVRKVMGGGEVFT